MDIQMIEDDIDIELEKVEYDTKLLEIEEIDRDDVLPYCENYDCDHSPKYVVQDLKGFDSNTYAIKSKTMMAWINGNAYCGGCLDKAYKYIKSKLDRKLWTFR
jgi:hypothetical protein